jgi:hypothetical protein
MTFPLALLGRADEVIEGDEVIEAPTACPFLASLSGSK